MTIGIDARLWSQTGVGRYIRNICINLHSIDKHNEYVLFVREEDVQDINKKIKNKNWKLVETNIKWHSIGEHYKFPRIIRKQKVDLMHFPYIDIPFFYRNPYVITIHDLIYHHFMTGKASTQPLWLYGFKMIGYRIVINNAARSAKKIISVSNSTREEIFDHLMVNKRNVEVVYEGADDFNVEPSSKPEFTNYFLYVGNVYPHKNADMLIDAFEKILEKKNCKLIFVGKDDYFYKKLNKRLSGLIKKEKVILKYDVSDKELASLYKNAIALVRPSLMEGFSLPPLEAMSMSCPAIVSDIPVHKEIFGDSVYYFGLNDSVDLSEKMLYVLNLDIRGRDKKIAEGKKQVKKYSWEDAARKTLSVYENAIA